MGTILFGGGAGDIIDGGPGYDEWVITNNSTDFTELSVVNIEELDIASNPLTITAQDILDITDENNELAISGTTDAILTSTYQNWVQGDDRTIDGEQYNSYSSGDATLLVDVEIIQHIS